MDIILLRHGETLDNISKVFGRDDTVLSEAGKKEVLNIKEILDSYNYEYVYNSPLLRVKQTMELLDIKGEDRQELKEYDFGIFTGYTYKEILKNYPEETKAWIKNPLRYEIPEGDNLEDKFNQLSDFLNEISLKDENVLLVAHAGIIQLAMCWAFDNLDYFYKFKVDTASISVITVRKKFKYINQLNIK